MRPALLVLTATACATASDRAPLEAAAVTEAPATLDPRFVETIRTAARTYVRWGRVDARPNIAPMLCRMPTRADYGLRAQVRRSDAPASPHGDKLYYLWASHQQAYLELARSEAAMPVGFTIVKEAFVAEHGAAPTADLEDVGLPGREPAPIRSMVVGGTPVHVGAPHGVYVMTKVGTDADGTDAGWIYGTVTPDGTVTSAGTVARCIGCHEGAPHERLFGLQPAKGVAAADANLPRGMLDE